MLNEMLKYGPIDKAALRKDGKIYTGKNHAQCFIQEPKGVLRDAEQGFLTVNNIFVDRILGLKIANYFNQIKFKHPPENLLFSEDLLEDVINYKER